MEFGTSLKLTFRELKINFVIYTLNLTMAIFKYCFVFLMIVIISNAIDQHNQANTEESYEVDDGSDEVELDYYSDDDYVDWKPFPGRIIIFYSFFMCE
jgi:hypothetical protein